MNPKGNESLKLSIPKDLGCSLTISWQKSTDFQEIKAYMVSQGKGTREKTSHDLIEWSRWHERWNSLLLFRVFLSWQMDVLQQYASWAPQLLLLTCSATHSSHWVSPKLHSGGLSPTLTGREYAGVSCSLVSAHNIDCQLTQKIGVWEHHLLLFHSNSYTILTREYIAISSSLLHPAQGFPYPLGEHFHQKKCSHSGKSLTTTFEGKFTQAINAVIAGIALIFKKKSN